VFVSQLNDCPFCSGVHAGIADRRDVGISDPLGQWRQGAVEARMAATFGLLEKVTLTPDALGPEDITRVRDAGVPDSAILDALYVCYFFNAINRIANAFGFDWDTDADRRKLAEGLDRIGYHVPEFFLR
jgi:alkylhydroperoxidase family enzyme